MRKTVKFSTFEHSNIFLNIRTKIERPTHAVEHSNSLFRTFEQNMSAPDVLFSQRKNTQIETLFSEKSKGQITYEAIRKS